MDIIYIHTHDVGRYIEPYGYNVPTPCLVEFARDSTIFRNAYCAGPTCSPSRAAMLSGMYPHSNGMIGLAHLNFVMNDYKQHLSFYLKDNGYHTVLCGEQHEAKNVDSLSYIEYLSKDTKGSADEKDVINAQSAAMYVEAFPKDKKLFLSFGMLCTHRPFVKKGDVSPEMVRVPAPLPDTYTIRQDYAHYINGAKIMDRCVGIVLDALKKSGRYDSSLVFFTTDHGIAFPLMKCNLTDAGTGVSLIMKAPGKKGEKTVGKSVDSLVSHVDVFPTICEYAGVKIPEYVQGRSLVGIMEGKTDEVNTEIFAETTYHAAYEPMRAIRTKRYKLIKLYDPDTTVVPCNIDASASKDEMFGFGLNEVKRDDEMLFDLMLDPNEKANLINSEAHQEIKDDLLSRLQAFMVKTNDPILKGVRPYVEGAKVMKRHSRPADMDWEE